MTINASLHHVSKMEAKRSEGASWLTMSDNRGNRISVFMDYDTACEIAEMWEWSQREPEPPTYDEALAMKCDADARNDEAMRVKGMLG